MASGYIRIDNGTPTSIPLNRLVAKADEDQLLADLSTLYGKPCSIVSACMPGETFVPPVGGTLLYDAMIIPGVSDNFVPPLAINCGQILAMRTSDAGKWTFDTAGNLAWQPAVPIAPPLSPPANVPNVIPGVNTVPVDYPDNSLNRALALFLTNEGFPPQ